MITELNLNNSLYLHVVGIANFIKNTSNKLDVFFVLVDENYLVSLWGVCFRQCLQSFFNSIRSIFSPERGLTRFRV